MLTPSASPRCGLFPLTEQDRGVLTEHFLSLDADARSLRFGTALADSGIRNIASRYPLKRTTQGIFVWDQLRASVSVIPVPGLPRVGELAVSVDDDVRGRGWGRWLVGQALADALSDGFEKVEVYYRGTNRAMASIMAKYPGEVETSYGEAHKVVDLLQWEREVGIYVGVAA